MKNIKSYKQFEAIGFKVKGDNRDEMNFLTSKKLGYRPHEVEDKIITLMRKLKEMADHERGDSAEKEVAMNKLKYIGRKYGVNPDNLDNKSRGLGYKFSWEDDEEYDMSDINGEIDKLLED